jgi:hypothetical protein
LESRPGHGTTEASRRGVVPHLRHGCFLCYVTIARRLRTGTAENYCRKASCLCAMKLELPAERPAAATVSTVDARMARCIQRAEAGEADAQCDLGIAHATGEAGGPASLTTAVSWFRRAAAQVRRDRHSGVSFARLCPREERSTAEAAVEHGRTRGRRGRSRRLTLASTVYNAGGALVQVASSVACIPRTTGAGRCPGSSPGCHSPSAGSRWRTVQPRRVLLRGRRSACGHRPGCEAVPRRR